MVEEESKSVKAIKLAKAVLESGQGSFGLIRFSIISLTSLNSAGEESDKWKLICSFFENMNSTEPTKYEAEINLKDNTVIVKKIGETQGVKYTVNRE